MFEPDKHGQLCKAPWTLVLVASGPHFRRWRVLVKAFSRFCRFERSLLQILTEHEPPAVALLPRALFKIPFVKIRRAFFLLQNRDFFHLREFDFKATSGRRNRAPPFFCSSNVLCFSSSAEFNRIVKLLRLGFHELEAKTFKCGIAARKEKFSNAVNGNCDFFAFTSGALLS